MSLMFARRTSIAFLAVLFLCVSTEASAVTRKRKPQATRITAMKVSTVGPTHEGEMGTLNDVFEGQTGNAPVFAGTGAANYPTHYLLVMVESTGELSNPNIELIGREGRRVVYRKISTANVPTGANFMAPVKSYAFFFIEGARCDTIRLTARLLGQRRPSTMTKTIQFACGE